MSEAKDRRKVEAELRAEVAKLLPGFKWKVREGIPDSTVIVATGILSAGFNRMGTIEVSCDAQCPRWYTVKSSGYGRRDPWGAEASGRTLAQAVRSLQQSYEAQARRYAGLAADIEGARAKKKAANDEG